MILKKRKFHYSKYTINISNINIDKIISGKFSLGKICFKYLIRYKVDEEDKPLCIMHPKMRERARNFDETKYIFF